jgi:hypothetical protein
MEDEGSVAAGIAGDTIGVAAAARARALVAAAKPGGSAERTVPNSSRAPSRATVMTPPQTAQRARTIPAGIFTGSIRKIDRHSGQVTFTGPP